MNSYKVFMAMYTGHMVEQYLVLLPSGPDTVHMPTIALWPLGTYYHSTLENLFPEEIQNEQLTPLMARITLELLFDAMTGINKKTDKTANKVVRPDSGRI